MKRFCIFLFAFLFILPLWAVEVGDNAFKTSFDETNTLSRWESWPATSFSIVGGALRVSVPANDTVKYAAAQQKLPAEQLRGAQLQISGRVKAENVETPPQPYNGIKMMLILNGPGGTQWLQYNGIWGTFDWREVFFYANAPEDITEATLFLGLEDTTGTVFFDDIIITVVGKKTDIPTKKPTTPVYKGHKLPRLRGVMVLPNSFKLDDLSVLAGDWKANHIRWQFAWDGFPNGPADTATVKEYDAWIDKQCAQLDKLLPEFERYGLLVTLDLHTPPGGRIPDDWSTAMRVFQEKQFQDAFVATWQKLARKYKDVKTIWSYDILNEPIEPQNMIYGKEILSWRELALKTSKEIRKIDPEKAIVIEPAPGGEPSAMEWFKPFDPSEVTNVLYSVHMYLPLSFTHQGVSTYYPYGVVYPGNMDDGKYWDKEQLRKSLQGIRDITTGYGVSMYIGEFSAIRWAPDNSAYRYLKDCIELFEEFGWDWSYHAFREADVWSVEFSNDINDAKKSAKPTDRELLLRSWFEKNERFQDNSAKSDEEYAGGGTEYDLDNEFDMDPDPVEPPPLKEPYDGDADSEIYTDYNFDDENAIQLAAGKYAPDELIVKFYSPSDVPGKEKQLELEISKVEKIDYISSMGIYVVRVEDFSKNPNEILNHFKNNKYIEYVEPNYILDFSFVPDDVYDGTLDEVFTAINAPEGWEITTGENSPAIAIIDSGVASHADLPKPFNEYSSAPSLAANNDKLDHGTGVAGVLGGMGDNVEGVAGINPRANIMSVKVDNADGVITMANVVNGIIWAADNGAKIMNLSYGTTADGVTLKAAIDYAYNKGAALFAMSGNDGKNRLRYPARYDNVMGVGSTKNGKARASSSNYGEGLDIVAAVSYVRTTAYGGYTNAAGTSFASPQAAGLASLILSVNPNLSNEEVYSLIKQGAKPLNGGYNTQTGYGLIDIGYTLKLALATVSSPVQDETRTPPVITLTSFAELTLEYGQAFSEMGYSAVDHDGSDITDRVEVTNNVDIWEAGIYTITYDVTDSADVGLTARATRKVIVNPQPHSPKAASAPKITINGSNPIVLHQTSSTPYMEQSARAIDYDGTDISHLVTISGVVDRYIAGTYTLTYEIISPATGLSDTATRDVQIISPTETKNPRVKYGFSGLAKAGAKVTHKYVVANSTGFLDLKVANIDKNMQITVQLVDTTSKEAVMTDTYSTAGAKQYRIDAGKYELVVTIDKASGNSKYSIELLADATYVFNEEEIPLFGGFAEKHTSIFGKIKMFFVKVFGVIKKIF